MYSRAFSARFVFVWLRTPSAPSSVAGFGIGAATCAWRTPRERPGARSSGGPGIKAFIDSGRAAVELQSGNSDRLRVAVRDMIASFESLDPTIDRFDGLTDV